jgi:Polyketide cyclase / dehydrase and lipid transport
MQGAVTVHVNAAPAVVWPIVSDVTRIGELSPETFEARWIDGATGPAVGARFRGHVKRNEIGPVYWTTCEVTTCEPERDFGFAVIFGNRPLNNWRYQLEPSNGGTDITESFHLLGGGALKLYAGTLGKLRRRRNLRDMQRTLEKVKEIAEASV